MTHLIRQQFLHVDFQGTEKEALELQLRLQRFCHAYLIPAMEMTLDRHAPKDRRVRLDRLELDVGQLPMEHLEYDLAGSISRALERTLKSELSMPGKTPRKASAQEGVLEAFLHFLEKGSLPWWFRLPAGADLEAAVTGCLEKADPQGSVAASLRREAPGLFASASVRKRVVLQFSERFQETLLSKISPSAAETVAAVLVRVQGLKVPPALLKEVRAKVTETALALLAAEGTVSRRELAAFAWGLVSPATSDHGELARLFELLLEGATVSEADPVDAGKGPLQLPPEVKATAQDAAITGSGGQFGTDLDAKQGWYVENAGLILLHPFLPQLFAALNLAAGDEVTEAERALCLLHFLATGALKAPEYELLLPKLLCGVDLRQPVASDLLLTKAEREECTALLEAAIGHWGALGESSPDALRGTFLLRPGKLSQREDGDWLLQVEPSGFDILLEQLPWSISMIRLPWMDAVLRVEWSA